METLRGNKPNDNSAIAITNADFISGSLPVNSYIRPNRIFTADKNIIIRKAGTINNTIFDNVVDAVYKLIKR